MAAFVKLNGRLVRNYFEFHVQDKPLNKLPDINPTDVDSIQLDGHELEYAQTTLGAAQVNKRVVTYFGDEARRILFNW
jgi:hypothetical protein